MKYFLLSLVLLAPAVYATQVDDLNIAIASMDTEVATTTATEQSAIDLLNQTNVTTSAVLVAGVAVGDRATDIDIPLTLMRGPASISAFQFSISLPPGISVSTITASPAMVAAGKTVSFSTSTLSTVVFGATQTPLPKGLIATMRLTVASGVLSGIYSVGLSNPIAVDPSGNPIFISVTTGSLRIN